MLFSMNTSECKELRTARLAFCLGQGKRYPEQSYTQRCNLLKFQSSNTVGRVVLWVDCDYVRRVAARGWFKPGSANADLWQLYFNIRGSLRCSLTVRRIWRSHPKAEDIERGFIPRYHVLGNEVADCLARRGADMSQVSDADATAVREADSRAWLVQSRILHAHRLAIESDPSQPAVRRSCFDGVVPVNAGHKKVSLGERFTELERLGHELQRRLALFPMFAFCA